MVKEMISKRELETALKLAKLELDEGQKELFYREINSFFSNYSKFRELEVGEIEKDTKNADYGKHFNEDNIKPSLPQSTVLAMTKYKENGYIQVPRIL